MAAKDWVADRASSRGAAIAYYTAFSLGPLLVLVISVAGLVWGQDAARGAVVEELSGAMGREGAEVLQGLIEKARDTGSGVLGTVVSIVLLLVGATTVFGEIQNSLNEMWKAPPARRASGLWGLVRTRLLSLSLILAIGFLLLVSLVVSTLIASFGRYLAGGTPGLAAVMEAANLLVSVAVTTALFGLVYKILPDRDVEWRDVVVGAFVTAVLFHIGKYAIALYVGMSDVASPFGASGAVIVVLVWVYYSAQVFLLGAEFTKVYAFKRGSAQREAAAPDERAGGLAGTR